MSTSTAGVTCRRADLMTDRHSIHLGTWKLSCNEKPFPPHEPPMRENITHRVIGQMHYRAQDIPPRVGSPSDLAPAILVTAALDLHLDGAIPRVLRDPEGMRFPHVRNHVQARSEKVPDVRRLVEVIHLHRKRGCIGLFHEPSECAPCWSVPRLQVCSDPAQQQQGHKGSNRVHATLV